MPIFQYTAMDASGKEQKGQHEAASEEAVASFLKEQGMFPTSIKPLAKVAKAKKEKAKGPSAAKGLNLNLGPVVMKGLMEVGNIPCSFRKEATASSLAASCCPFCSLPAASIAVYWKIGIL